MKKTLTRGRGRGRGRGGTCGRGRYESESSQEDLHFKKVEKKQQRCRSRGSTHGRCMQVRSSSESSREDLDTDGYDSTITCPVCGFTENGIDPWIACNVCDAWYHICCANLNSESDFDEMDWKCFNCQ